MQHYNVAFGYTAQDCANQGRAFPCYGPTDPVSYAQTLAFIARAMIVKGFWVAQPNAPLPGGNVPGVLATPLRTFAYYTGGIPTAPTDWNAGARRAAGSPQPSGPRWIATGAPTATCPTADRAGGTCPNACVTSAPCAAPAGEDSPAGAARSRRDGRHDDSLLYRQTVR